MCFWDLIDATLADVVDVSDTSPGLIERDPEDFVTFIAGLSNEAERWLAKYVRAGILTLWSEAFNMYFNRRQMQKEAEKSKKIQTDRSSAINYD